MNDLIDWFISQGRIGGALLLVPGLALLAVPFVESQLTGGFHLLPPALGIVLAPLGALLLVFGGGRRIDLSAQEVDPEFLDKLVERERPFYACTRCRSFPDGPWCPRCDSEVQVYVVEGDEDLRMVLADLS